MMWEGGLMRERKIEGGRENLSRGKGTHVDYLTLQGKGSLEKRE